jgi:uncharacterized protein (TIGR00725 family)
MKYKIGVMGKAGRSKDLPKILIKNAEIIGREIVKQGCTLVTGACMGVPDVAAKAASKAGGIILGYSPAKNLKEHIEPPISYPYPPENMQLVFTGMGKVGRNVLSIISSDGIIFIGGGIGSLNEFSIAYHEGKIIGILEGMIGISEKFEEMIKSFDKNTEAVLVKDRDPKRLVKKIIEAIKKREIGPRREVSVTFRNEKGKQLVGILHLPKKEKPPLVIICHGFDRTKTDKKFVELARTLQKEGIATFRFDFEGCGDSEGNFGEMTIKREARDLNSALKTVLKEGDFDSSKIAFIGDSLGAVVISLFVKNFKCPVETMVFWVQAFNQRELFKVWHTKKEIKKWEKQGYLIKGDKMLGRAYLNENKETDYSSVFSEISEIPILLIHGKKDKDVPLKFSKTLARKYKNIKLKILQKADHKFANFASRKELIKLTVNWLKEYL